MEIGVYGSEDCLDPVIRRKAREIGAEIARRGHTVITGAGGGYPHDAVLGAYEIGGRCIGFSPAPDLGRHVEYGLPTEGFSGFVFVPQDYEHIDRVNVCRKFRNVSSVAAADRVVIIGGRIGTMNEVTIAYDLDRSIGILDGSGGITESSIDALLREAEKDSRSRIIRHADPVLLLKNLIDTFSPEF